MDPIDTFTVINRPQIEGQPRWNLVASQIGGAVLLKVSERAAAEEDQRRQNAVLGALGCGISDQGRISDYAKEAYGVEVQSPPDEVNAAKERYRATTALEALSLAITDGSVPSVQRPGFTAPADVVKFLNLIASGKSPEPAAKEAGGDDLQRWQGTQGYLRRVCTVFGVRSLYAALRLGHEHGMVIGRTPPIHRQCAGDSEYAVPAQASFTLEPRTIDELKLKPNELAAGRLRAAGLYAADIALEMKLGVYTVKGCLGRLYRKLEADDAAEAVTKLIVLGLASPHDQVRAGVKKTITITARELSILTGVSQGLSNAEIGNKLDGLSEDVVKNRLRSVNAKVGTQDRAAAAVLMFQIGAFKAA